MPRLKRATLTDVARRAGVSVTTASYILNGRAEQMRISAETASRVRDARDELHYRPNWSARTLRGSSTHTIGLISDYIAGGAFASQLLTGANAGAREGGQLLVIGETLGDPDVERRLIEELHSRQVEGVVYATLTASTVRVPDALRGVRTVLLNCVDPEAALSAVLPDDLGGGRTAAELLLAARPDGPVHVVGEDPTPGATAGVERLQGIEQALAEHGRSLDGVIACEWDVEPAQGAVSAWLDAGGRPGGLICLNDRVAMGVYQALRDHGLEVPTDVSVIAFDGSDLASWLRPKVTSLRLPLLEMGSRAVEVLMDGRRRGDGVERMPLTVVEGGSLR